MSISSYTTVTMLDSRPSQITISVPRSTDITNRIITFKDLYGSASNSTIILVTRTGDTFEDGTFSTIMSNAYQTLNLYAGQPGKWLNIGATGSGADSAGLITVSNRLNGVSTSVITVSTNLDTVSNRLNGVSTSLITVSTNLDTVSNRLNGVSTNVITVSTSLNTVSNTVASGRFPGISTNNISTNLVAAAYISSPQGYISSLIVDSLAFSLSNSFIVMGDIITTSVSTIQTFTSSLTTNNLKVGTVSSLNYIAFSGLQQGYNQTVIAEQSTGTGLQELLVFRGSSASDRIRMQTTGPIIFEPGVSARVFPATGSNVTPAMIINTSSNVGIGIAAPTVSLDVAGAGRFTAVSTQTISTASITAGATLNVTATNASFSGEIQSQGGTVRIVGNATTLDLWNFCSLTQNSGNITINSYSNINTTASSNINLNATSTINISSGANGINLNASTINLRGALNSAVRIGPSQYQGTAADTTTYGLERSRHELRFAGYRDAQIDKIGSKIVNINKQTYGNSGLRHLIQSADLAFFTVSPDTADIDNTVERMRITDSGTVGIGVTAPTVSLDVDGAGRFTAISTNTISTNTLTVGGTSITGRLNILSNATLTHPASIIIGTPNTSYFYADYTNLTNYITISNYGAVSGDYINIVNTGNSGAPATFQVLDGSTGASTIIRYIYPGHAGVVAYSGSQWWPL